MHYPEAKAAPWHATYCDETRHPRRAPGPAGPAAEGDRGSPTGAASRRRGRRAGVARQTVHRWLADDPEFIAAYNLARREMADAVAQSLRVLSVQSVRVLKRALTSRETPAAVKVRAAVEVLRMAAKPPEGPTDVEDARNIVARRDKARRLAGLIAR